MGAFEPDEKTGLPKKQPQTMQAYAGQMAKAKEQYKELALKILNEEVPNPVQGAIGQGGMIDLYSEYPARDTLGNYKGQAKDGYWEDVKAKRRYLQIGTSVFVWKKAEDVPGPASESAPTTVHPALVTPVDRAISRQVTDASVEQKRPAAAPAARSDLNLKEILQWTQRLSGLPCAFSADSTMAEIGKKQRQLADDIAALKKQLADAKPGSGASGDQVQDREAAQKALDQTGQELARPDGLLAGAKEAYWQTTLRDLVLAKTGPAASSELLAALHDHGVVCNTYVEAVMRMSGAGDFPLSGQIDPPQSESFTKLDESRMKAKGGVPGWGLQWAERMVDWASANGSVLYDDAKPPAVRPAPEPGDIVIFRRPGGTYHVNIVVADDEGRFNFIGASRPGRATGRALATPFKTCADMLPAHGGSQTIPQTMGQKRYEWILRPGRAMPAHDQQPQD